MARRGLARNPKPDSIAANPDAGRLLTFLFTKEILKKGIKLKGSISILHTIRTFRKLPWKNFGSDTPSCIPKNLVQRMRASYRYFNLLLNLFIGKFQEKRCFAHLKLIMV